MTLGDLLSYTESLNIYDYAMIYIFAFFSFIIVKNILRLKDFDNVFSSVDTTKLNLSNKSLALVLVLLSYSYAYSLTKKIFEVTEINISSLDIKILSIFILVLLIYLLETLRRIIRTKLIAVFNQPLINEQKEEKQRFQPTAKVIVHNNILKDLAKKQSVSVHILEAEHLRFLYLYAILNLVYLSASIYSYTLTIIVVVWFLYIFWPATTTRLKRVSRLSVKEVLGYE
jgi:hypothetical protein